MVSNDKVPKMVIMLLMYPYTWNDYDTNLPI